MDANEIEHRKKMQDIIRRIPTGIPDGWEKITYAVGGLTYLGFSNIHTEKLVVISTQRQSVIDCKTGSKTYCRENYDEDKEKYKEMLVVKDFYELEKLLQSEII